VHRWIDRTLGVKHARPALFSLPAPGQILVAGQAGTWTVSSDGSKRRLGPWRDATWSPHALYVAVAQRDQLAALNLRGITQWSVARPDVRFPRWYAPNGYRIAYLSASSLRVVAGDGGGDRQLARGVASVAPAWRPDHPYEVAYATRGGELVARDADTAAIEWRRQVQPRPRMLSWSANGSRLLVLTKATALVYDASGRRIARIVAGGGLSDGALSPDGRRVALLSGGELTVTDVGGRTRRLFAGAGLRQLAFSPDGQWLLVGWPRTSGSSCTPPDVRGSSPCPGSRSSSAPSRRSRVGAAPSAALRPSALGQWKAVACRKRWARPGCSSRRAAASRPTA
jgi:hypothetical protein